MHLDLTPEIQRALEAEAKATGLTPVEVTLRILATYAERTFGDGPPDRAQQVSSSHPSAISARIMSPDPEPSAEVLERRRAAFERILSRRDAPDAPRLNLPEGMSIREYMHEDYRY